MAQVEVVTLIDDFTGVDKMVQATRFSVDGLFFEIDLSPEQKQKMMRALGPYLRRARSVPGPARPHERVPPHDPRLVRQWAARRGLTYPRRGWLPKALVEQYLEERATTV